ncbi:MAG: 3D domain-containing protein [Pseudobdellovibrionaceae bacterium]
MKNLFVLLLVSIMMSFIASADETPDAQPIPEPPIEQPPSDFTPGGEIIPTIYYKPILTVDNTKCLEADIQDIMDVQGSVLVRVCPPLLKKCAIQGSCILKVEQKVLSLTFMKKIDNTYRFKETSEENCPYGLGVKNICLDPFFSIAADLTIYKPGDVIFIAELMGLKLPNGEYHNGFLVVRDSGGNIKGEHRFDFFTGFFPYGDQSNPFSVLKLDVKSTRMPYFKVGGRTAELVKRSRTYPLVPKRSWPPKTIVDSISGL